MAQKMAEPKSSMVWFGVGAALAHPLDDRAPQQVAGERDFVRAQRDAQKLLCILVAFGQQAQPDHRLGHAEVCEPQQPHVLREGVRQLRLAPFGEDVLQLDQRILPPSDLRLHLNLVALRRGRYSQVLTAHVGQLVL